MPLRVNFNILNQKGTPAFYSDIFANRPAAGYAGRVFISTDTGAIYEDNGSTWTLIADAGAGTTGTLQQVTTNGNTTTQGITITAGGLSSNSINNTALTTGSVLFSGASGLITQDNANLFWDDTNNRLGIGTAVPGAPLDVHSTGTAAQFNGTGTNNAFIRFQNAGSNKWTIGNQYAGGVNNFTIENNAGNSVINITGGQQVNLAYNATIAQTLTLNGVGDQLRLSSGLIDARLKTSASDNNLYIGATSITTNGINIDLSTGSLTATNYKLTGQTGNTGMYYSGSRLTIANYNISGTVEIEVNGGSSAATFNADLSTTFAKSINVNSTGSTQIFLKNSGGGSNRDWQIQTNESAAGDLSFLQSTTAGGSTYATKINFGASGSVGIGIAAQTDKLFIFNASGTNTGLTIQQDGTGDILRVNGNSGVNRVNVTELGNIGINRNASSNVKLYITGNSSTSADYVFISQNSTQDIFYIRNDGYINTGLAANSPYNYNVTFAPRTAGLDAAGGFGYIVSTRESKGNIQTINNVDFINKLNPVSFNYRKKNINNTEFIDQLYDDIYFGFIADEVELVNKDLVFYDTQKDGTKKLSGVEYNSMIAILVKAVQELNKKLERNNIN